MSNVQNFALTGVTDSVRKGLPTQYLVGVILSYVVNAALIAFLLYPTFLRIAANNSLLALAVVGAGSAVVQYFRYLIVFTDQLVPNGVQSSRGIVRVVAFGMWLFSAIEVYHATAGIGWLEGSQFWGLVLFGWGIVTGGYVLEISFVKKVNEITDLQVGEGYIDDEEVRNRIRQEQAQQRRSTPSQQQPASNTITYTPSEMMAIAAAYNITQDQMEEIRLAKVNKEPEASILEIINGYSTLNQYKDKNKQTAQQMRQSNATPTLSPLRKILKDYFDNNTIPTDLTQWYKSNLDDDFLAHALTQNAEFWFNMPEALREKVADFFPESFDINKPLEFDLTKKVNGVHH